MSVQRFTSTVLDGHAGPAFEVPFDPTKAWGVPAVSLRPGRRGHHVRGMVNGVTFETAVVGRSRRFFALVDHRLQEAAGISVGDEVTVSLEPCDGPTVRKPPALSPAPKRSASKRPLARARRICLALPEATEKEAWGAPTFRVRDKIFAMYADNHHGDGRTALWLNCESATQQETIASDAERFFYPAYVGCKGWLGVRLDRGLDWDVVAEFVRAAYLRTAPKRLVALLDG
jgi:predicted DNA-binding protein (MmcQ/YjbR family)